MNSYQKLNDFMTRYLTDNLYYYVNGKLNFSIDLMLEKSASREFLVRQIKIQLDEVILPTCTLTLRKGDKELLEQELERLFALMNIHSFSLSFTKDDWRSLTHVLLKVVLKRLESIDSSNEFHLKVKDFLTSQITLNEQEQLNLCLFN